MCRKRRTISTGDTHQFFRSAALGRHIPRRGNCCRPSWIWWGRRNCHVWREAGLLGGNRYRGHFVYRGIGPKRRLTNRIHFATDDQQGQQGISRGPLLL